jgi:DNA-binding response OmpR family regulator
MKILIVEDDNFLETLVARKFVSAGVEVIGVENGKDAIGEMEREKPDVVLLDVMMPGMDGFEVLRKVMENPKIAHIPIIVFSNFSEDEKIKEAKNLGARDYLIKSNFTLDELLIKIKDILMQSPDAETRDIDTFFRNLTK